MQEVDLGNGNDLPIQASLGSQNKDNLFKRTNNPNNLVSSFNYSTNSLEIGGNITNSTNDTVFQTPKPGSNSSSKGISQNNDPELGSRIDVENASFDGARSKHGFSVKGRNVFVDLTVATE